MDRIDLPRPAFHLHTPKPPEFWGIFVAVTLHRWEKKTEFCKTGCLSSVPLLPLCGWSLTLNSIKFPDFETIFFRWGHGCTLRQIGPSAVFFACGLGAGTSVRSTTTDMAAAWPDVNTWRFLPNLLANCRCVYIQASLRQDKLIGELLPLTLGDVRFLIEHLKNTVTLFDKRKQVKLSGL